MQKGDYLPDKSSRMFEVICKGCGRSLAKVERIRDSQIVLVTDHLRACAPSEPLGDAPILGEIMRGLCVLPVDHPMNTSVPPDQAAVTAKRESR